MHELQTNCSNSMVYTRGVQSFQIEGHWGRFWWQVDHIVSYRLCWGSTASVSFKLLYSKTLWIITQLSPNSYCRLHVCSMCINKTFKRWFCTSIDLHMQKLSVALCLERPHKCGWGATCWTALVYTVSNFSSVLFYFQ